jgi:hypothetical protein
MIDGGEKEFVPYFTRIFNWFCRREPYMKEYQWHFMVVLNILFYLSFVAIFFLIGNQCNITGLEELNRSCDACVNTCIYGRMNNSNYGGIENPNIFSPNVTSLISNESNMVESLNNS